MLNIVRMNGATYGVTCVPTKRGASTANTMDASFLARPGPFAGPGFVPFQVPPPQGPGAVAIPSTSTSNLKQDKQPAMDATGPFASKILIIGAGGLGCELLKDLATMGFRDIHIIDMDTVDVSNLNRQFLFTEADVGQPKAIVAARTVSKRISACRITPHHCKIQDFDFAFYSQFAVVVCGLDSVEARRWINSKIVALNMDPTVAREAKRRAREAYSGGNDSNDSNNNNKNNEEEADEEDEDEILVLPIVDGGTEGFKGQSRVIVPGITACYECSLDMQTKPKTFPICTIANTPRLPEHCVEYAAVIQWPDVNKETRLDGDIPEHVEQILAWATERANLFGITTTGMTFSFAQGIIKNIIPAIASTNAIVAASCSLEVLKLVTNCSPGMNNYMMFVGDDGVYTFTFALDKKDNCSVCGVSSVTINIPTFNYTLQELMEVLNTREDLRLKSPSVTTSTGKTLYMSGPASLEEATRPNLSLPLVELVSESKSMDQLQRTQFVVTDRSLFDVTLNVHVKYTGEK